MLRQLIGLLAACSMSGFAQEPAKVNVKVVKGSPFSAEAVTESTRVLADGNRIVRKSSASIARDSEGRTRRQQGIAGGASIIFIQDPVASAGYVIDPRTKSARRIAVTGGDSKRTEPILNQESLGIQVIEGILAEGTRSKRTLAPGEAGNESALETVTEAWYSSELQTMVMTRTIDPRLGETVYRLSSVQRGEPAHLLFEVPADYSVQDDAPLLARKEKAERLKKLPKPKKPRGKD